MIITIRVVDDNSNLATIYMVISLCSPVVSFYSFLHISWMKMKKYIFLYLSAMFQYF